MTNLHLPGYPKHGEYRKTTLQLVSSDGKQTMQPLKSESTQPGGFGGGGNDMDNRLTILERDFAHTKSDIGEIKSDIKELRSSISSANINLGSDINKRFMWIMTILLGLYASIGGVYLLLDNRLDYLGEKVVSIQGDVTKISSEVSELKQDVREIKFDVNSIKSSLDKLSASVDKLAKDK